MKKEWEAPVILEVNALPEALGECAYGQTGTVYKCVGGGIPSMLGCRNGNITSTCQAGAVASQFCITGTGGH